MTFIGLSLKNLLRHKTRNLLTLLGITTAVIVLYAILSFNKSFIQNLNEELSKTGIEFLVVPAGCPHEVASLVLHGSVIPKFLPDDINDKIKNTLKENLDATSPILVFQMPNYSTNRVDLIYGMEFKNLKKIKPSWKIKGNLPSSDKELLLGHEIATQFNLKTGDSYTFERGGEVFIVSGVIEKTFSKDDVFIYAPLSLAQKMIKKEHALTAVGVKIKDPSKLNDVVDLLSKEIPGIQIVTINQIITSISTLAASARVLSLSVVAIAILISTIGVLNSILMTVFERTQEIGMMRAIGASKSNIFKIIIEESIILTGLGGFLGIIIAIVLSKGIERFVKSFMPYVPQGDLVTFEPFLAFLCFAFTVFLGIIAGLYPAYKATKISPMEAIKG